jgi:23S rRNA (cytosine1962-C5)-methyltransferase
VDAPDAGKTGSAAASVILKSGRDKSVRQMHPRLFSGAIKDVIGKPRDGDVVDISDNKGEWLARGVINQLSSTAVRILTWDHAEAIDDALFERRIAAAFARRAADPLLGHTNARRVVFGESDGLPGLIADDYAGHVVAEFSALVAITRRDAIMAALRAQPGVKSVFERLDDERLRSEYGNNARRVEALKRAVEPVDPPVSVIEPTPERVQIAEDQLQFAVNLASGQKTGFYLDQRANRAAVARYCLGARVLNAFSYTGAFAVHALAAGATHAVNVDASQDALALAAVNAELNGQSAQTTHMCADVFDDLRTRRAAGERFDVIVLDPPKMAHHAGQIDKAARAYKDLNRVALALLNPGGVLATFSCSGVIDVVLLQQIVFSAALEAKREARIVERLSQASDHPVLTTFPEAGYLKGFVLRVA